MNGVTKALLPGLTLWLASAPTLALVVGPETEPGAPPASAARARQDFVAIAAGTTGALAAWEDDRDFANRGTEIRATQLDANGVVQDVVGLDLAPLGGHLPCVAFANGLFLVVWNASGQLLGTYVDPASGPSNNVFVIGASVDDACAISSDGQIFVVGWHVDANDLGFAFVNGSTIGTTLKLTATGSTGGLGIGWDGAEFVVAWSDSESGAEMFSFTTLTPSGALKTGTTVEGASSGASLATNGGKLLATWLERRTDGDRLWGQLFQRGARYGDAFAVGTAAQHADAPVVMALGADFLVTWPESDGTGPHDLYGAMVDGTAAVLGTGMPLVVAVGDARSPAGIDGRLAWSLGGDVVSGALGVDTTLDDADALPLATTAAWREQLALAFGATGLATWVEVTDATSADVRLATLTPGLLFDSPISLTTPAGPQESPAIAAVLSGFNVAWNDARDPDVSQIRVARVRAGTVLEPDGVAVSGSRVSNVGAPSASGTFVAWRESTVLGATISAALIADGGGIGSGGRDVVSPGTTALSDPRVAATNAGALVTWSSSAGISLRQVDSTGVASGSVVNVATDADVVDSPDIAFGIDNAIVIWARAAGGVFATRVNDDATLVNVTPEELTSGPELVASPRVVFDGASFIVLWSTASGLEGVRVAQDGTLLDANLKLEFAPASFTLSSPGSAITVVSYDRFDAASPYDSERLFTRTLTFPPVATSTAYTLAENTTVTFTLAATDLDDTRPIFRIVAPPTRGTLSGTPPTLTYTPTNDVSGDDSFTFAVDDAGQSSAPGTVTFHVSPQNQPPVASNSVVTTQVNTNVSFTLRAVDPDGDAVTFRILQQPGHGRLAGTPPNLVYGPAQDFCGDDLLTFVADDPSDAESQAATVTIHVVEEDGSACPTEQPVKQGTSCNGCMSVDAASLALLGLLLRRRRG